jgi:hypothetical protein
MYVGLQENLDFLNRLSQHKQIRDLIKIRALGAALLHADGQTHRETQTDRLDEYKFYISLLPCISLQFFANDQIDALFCICIYYTTLRVSNIIVLIIRRLNCINESSGMISLCK